MTVHHIAWNVGESQFISVQLTSQPELRHSEGEPVKHSIQHSPNGCFGLISSCGINFPIESEEMVEVLESMVKEYDGARDEYVAFLREQMSPNANLLTKFSNIFADSAMYGYNFSGLCNRGPQRKAMQEYEIFTGCMTDEESQSLSLQLTSQPELRHSEGEPVKHSIQHSPNGCFGLISSCGINFPIESEEMVEVLESMVKEYDGARDEYICLSVLGGFYCQVAFLREQMSPNASLLTKFSNIFADSAMYGYNFSGLCNRGPKRKAMQEYEIFTGCMTDAWSEYGINSDTLRDQLTMVIKYINGRKRNRKYFKRRRERRKISAANRTSTSE
ncbi:hypothetical protein ZHAS_00021562 [Anopheles sinensis]|uniref:DUF4806 domain-containing protein n=1 Tax=Anopheles sinensis TaxID=74873 RepID=A0A084WSR5_ANOSI|nr:hypothetical protein ZHAS_00021562 [Anopheles sinensis]